MCLAFVPAQIALRQFASLEKPNPRMAEGLDEKLERETRLELATPTLARSCSTN